MWVLKDNFDWVLKCQGYIKRVERGRFCVCFVGSFFYLYWLGSSLEIHSIFIGQLTSHGSLSMTYDSYDVYD